MKDDVGENVGSESPSLALGERPVVGAARDRPQRTAAGDRRLLVRGVRDADAGGRALPRRGHGARLALGSVSAT